MAFEYRFSIKDDGTATIKKVGQNVDNVRKKLTDAEKSANFFTKSISKMDAAFAGLASIGMAKGISVLKDFAKEMVQNYDSASKLSDNIGVAAESIVGLRYAADLSGVGAENLDKNLAKLSKRISEAASGNKAAADTFAKMGIEVKNTDGTLKNSEQVLKEMADKFQKLPAGVERATLAMDVFGKSGASMVSMLKDGSGALSEIASEGAGAAGDIKKVSKAMADLNSAGTKAKAAIQGLMASFADTSVFKGFILTVEDAAKALRNFNVARKESNEKKQTQELEKITKETQKYHELQLKIEKQEKKVEDLKKSKATVKTRGSGGRSLGNSLTSAARDLQQLKDQFEEMEKKKYTIDVPLFGHVEIDQLSHFKAELEGLIQARETYKKSGENFSELNYEIKLRQSIIEGIEDEAAETKKGQNAEAAAVAGYKDGQTEKTTAVKKHDEAAKEAARKEKEYWAEVVRGINDSVQRYDSAVKELSGLEETMHIASLSGEAKKRAEMEANFKKQMKNLEELHAAELMYSDDPNIYGKQLDRQIAMQTNYENELKKMKKENANSIAEYEENMRIERLKGTKKEQAELLRNYRQQRKELERLHEAELSMSNDKVKAHERQNARMSQLDRAYYDELKQMEENRAKMERELKIQGVSDSLQAIQQITGGYKSYAAVYKASQIGEALINSYQAILKTMASIPFPFNIPLAALQAAAGAVQVRKISETKMYRGGMIPGRNTLIHANEEGPEALLTTRGVRNAGGPAGVNALNNGSSYTKNSYDQRKSQITVNVRSTFLSQREWERHIAPQIRWAGVRR